MLWRKGPGCKFAEIPGLDPEQFHPLSNAVAQYQDRLYVIRKTEFGENQLDVVTLDNPNLVIDKRFNAGRHHGYLLTKTRSDFKEEDGLQVFESAGPLILMDYHVPGETEAHLGDSHITKNGTRATIAMFTRLMALNCGAILRPIPKLYA